MEPISVVAATAIALIFSEAAKEGGKGLGKSAITAISKLSSLIATKLEQPQQALLESNRDVLEGKIIGAAENDPNFAEEMTIAVQAAESNSEIKQVFLAGFEGEKSEIAIDNTDQKITKPAQKVDQSFIEEMKLTDVKITISNVNMEI